MKRGLDIFLLDVAVTLFAAGQKLPEKYRDYALMGNWNGARKCHILLDRLLIYRVEGDILVLTLIHTGSHSDPLKK